MKKFFLLALLVALAAGGYGLYSATQGPRVGGTPLVQLAPAEQAKRRNEARELTKQVGEVVRASRSRERKRFEIVATEEQLNTLLQDNLKTKNLPINNLRLGLQPGQIVLQGDGEYKGFSAPATLVGTLTPKEGGVSFAVTSLTMAGVPAPDNIRLKVETAVQENLAKFFQSGARGRVDTVAIEAGKMTVSGLSG